MGNTVINLYEKENKLLNSAIDKITVEIIDKYKPALLYFDWWIIHEAFRPYIKKLLAYYYNQGVKWGRRTAVCYKHDALSFGTGIVEIERGSFAEINSLDQDNFLKILKNIFTSILSILQEFQALCVILRFLPYKRSPIQPLSSL